MSITKEEIKKASKELERRVDEIKKGEVSPELYLSVYQCTLMLGILEELVGIKDLLSRRK